MQFDLTDEQQDIRRLVRDFAHGEVRPVADCCCIWTKFNASAGKGKNHGD